MMKKILKIMAVILAAAILLCGCSKERPEETVLDIAVNTAIGQKSVFGVKENKNLLTGNPGFASGMAVCDWTAIFYKEFGIEDDFEGYLAELEQKVTEEYAAEGGLDSTKATEWHRTILVVTALGGDATAFGTYPDGTKINLVADGIYNYINEDLANQGINGFIYALLALDCGGYEIPEGSRYTRESIVASLVAEQHEDGSFGFGTRSDVDMTGMALHALAPYTSDPEIKKAVERGIEFLSAEQNGDGSFSGMDIKTSESASQVIIALCANGIDPRTDERFIKHGTSVYDSLFEFRQEDKSFSHTLDDGKGDALATDQAMMALMALINFENGKSGAFIFTD
ncbi:MAG: hypothetical protein E7479_06990 [Ruminococcaceae bacterium]|nr:hypothetical protein [Oscillospiraceae bacterium]